MFSELEPRRACKENVWLAAGVNDYKVSVINLEKKLNEEELNGMVLLQETE